MRGDASRCRETGLTPFRRSIECCLGTIFAAAAVSLPACDGNVNTSPTAPTPAPAVNVMAVTVAGALPSNPTFQLTAMARMSDGRSQDVTQIATWASSNPQIATVSSTGDVTVVGNGELDVRATYQGVTGSQHLVVHTAFTLNGVVREIAPNSRPLAGATVRILSGAYPSAVTNDQGVFSVSGLPAGRLLIEITRNGYQVWESEFDVVDRDVQLLASLYPTPPNDVNGVSATARCSDGSWTWAQTLDAACPANGGIAYAVCPGPLCHSV